MRRQVLARTHGDDRRPAQAYGSIECDAYPVADDLAAAAFHLDRVVRHKAVPADDEVERAFALPDAALPHQQHPESEDV